MVETAGIEPAQGSHRDKRWGRLPTDDCGVVYAYRATDQPTGLRTKHYTVILMRSPKATVNRAQTGTKE